MATRVRYCIQDRGEYFHEGMKVLHDSILKISVGKQLISGQIVFSTSGTGPYLVKTAITSNRLPIYKGLQAFNSLQIISTTLSW